MQVDTPAILELRDICIFYGGMQALRGVSLRVAKEEMVALLGANGAGKTSTLNAIAGATPVKSGEILFSGERIDGSTPERLVEVGISLVPERRRLFPSMSVLDNLILGAYRRFRKDEKSEIERDLSLVFELFPILKERVGQPAGTLSGGQQQMVAVGRGLMARPRLLLLDEPSLGLAPMLVGELMDVIAALRERGLSILLVEQNARMALKIADRAYVMEAGAIVLEGQSSQLLEDERVQVHYLGKR